MRFGADLKWAEVGIENVKKAHKIVNSMILSIFKPTSLQPKSLLLQPNHVSLFSPLKVDGTYSSLFRPFCLTSLGLYRILQSLSMPSSDQKPTFLHIQICPETFLSNESFH